MENQNCEYCSGDEDLVSIEIPFFSYVFDLNISMAGQEPSLVCCSGIERDSDTSVFPRYKSIRFDYCPHCGRKLI